jgi:predicted nucleic acid-binding protein
MIILDTNVLSEMMRPDPDLNVATWLRKRSMLDLATTTINVAEIKYGIARLPAGKRRNNLEKQFFAFLSRGLGARILHFDEPAADIYGGIRAAAEKTGRRFDGFDGLILAIAGSRNATVATRNVADFAGSGVTIVNPWDPSMGWS